LPRSTMTEASAAASTASRAAGQGAAVLLMATQIAMRDNPAIAAFAERLAGKKPKVITACMRKLLVILNAIVRDRTEWKDQVA
jgi:hypothetical protein